MLRTLVLAGLVTLLGLTTSEAQYQDSAPPEEYEDEYNDGDDNYYDEELLGSPDYYDDDREYSEPDIDVGIFGNLGYDGSWHFAAGFGWVWRPYASASWRPYSMGRWVWTDYGWTWVSYEPFGWATYHYGYWTRDPMLGWVWIPGYEWSACRVQFAYYDNYISWAPLTPPGYYCPQPWSTAGISFWFTIGASNFCDPYPVRHCVTPRYKSWYSERVAYKSPDRHFVEQYTGAPVRASKVNFKNTTWSRGETTRAKFTSRGDGRDTRFTSKSDRMVTKSSRSYKSETRFVAPRNSGSGSYAMKSKPRQEVKRQFQTQEPRRTFSKREAVKPLRETGAQRENRITRAERSSKQSKQQFRAPSQSRESRMARADRSSKQQFKGSAVRAQRSFQKAQRTERNSRPSFHQVERGSRERKAMSAVNKSSDRREVAKTSKSGSGKGRAKAQ